MKRWVVVMMTVCAGMAFAQEKQEWEVHDRRRPQPPVVTPGEPSTQEKAGTAPSDAMNSTTASLGAVESRKRICRDRQGHQDDPHEAGIRRRAGSRRVDDADRQ
jgi:hypothetical protein